MKKWTVILLMILALTLTGCDLDISGFFGAPDQSGGETVVPFNPENPPEIDFDAPAMSVTVSIQPELELTLSFCNQILEAKALNADGETLLAGMDLVGKRYDDAMTAILQQAKEQGLLKHETAISLNIRELMEGARTVASQSILMRPIDVFQEKTGITLNCELTPAGDSAWVVDHVHTNRRDDHNEMICYNVGGQQVLNRYFYQNGDYEERYVLSDESVFWGGDGSFRYSGAKDGISVEYTLYPDGTRSTTIAVSDGNGNNVWHLRVYPDGATDEGFAEGGETVRTIYSHPDGYSWDHRYESGELVHSIITNVDGSICEYFYENGEVVRVIETDSNGNVTEQEENQEGTDPAVTVAPETAPFDN